MVFSRDGEIGKFVKPRFVIVRLHCITFAIYIIAIIYITFHNIFYLGLICILCWFKYFYCSAFPNEPWTGYFKLRDPVIMIKDLDLVKAVCVPEFNSFRNHGKSISREADPIFGRNPFFLEDNEWAIVLHSGNLVCFWIFLIFIYRWYTLLVYSNYSHI